MPGYWYDDRKSDAPSSYGAGHSSYDTDRGGGGGPPGRGDTGPSQAAIESARRANQAAAAKAASQALHAKQMQEMARGMQAAGQISGGLSGGTYTKGPVVYPREFYTDEGWAEVQRRGWSGKLANYKIQGKTPGEWILGAKRPQDVGGKLQDLPEGKS